MGGYWPDVLIPCEVFEDSASCDFEQIVCWNGDGDVREGAMMFCQCDELSIWLYPDIRIRKR